MRITRGRHPLHAPSFFDHSYRYRTFQVERRFAGNLDTFTGMLTKQLATPFRDLISMKIFLAQDRCPVGYQHTMR
jgi:hypothetical protein